MRFTTHSEGQILGYVQVKVASRIYSLPVKAAPLERGVAGDQVPGFFAEAADRFGILVDRDASDGEQRATIERASVEAVRHISRRLLN